MNIDYLEEDQLRIEFEIRGMADAASRGVTETLKITLRDRLDDEGRQPFSVPTRAHSQARKNPNFEVGKCSKELQALHTVIVSHSTDEELTEEELKEYQTKVLHIHGRLIRISSSPAVEKIISPVLHSCNMLMRIITDLSTKRITLDDSHDHLSHLKVQNWIETDTADENPITNPQPGCSNERRGCSPVQHSNHSSQSSESIHSDNEYTPAQAFQKFRGEIMENFTQLRLDLDKKLVKPSVEKQVCELKLESPTPSINEDFDCPTELNVQMDPRGMNPRVCKDISSWDLKFQGMRSPLHIERFLYRVERMASKSSIPLNYLVDYLSVYLFGEAREWYWVHLERNPKITWTQLKQELTQRFQASRSDDDVRRQLNQRKQWYPRESFQEFYDAILRIALQAKHPLSDVEIWRVLKRNMRPGLQLELYDTKSYPSLSYFIQKCVSMKDVWQRLNHDPEATI